MTIRIEVASESGIVAVADPGAALPGGLDQAALLRQLEPMASAGDAFYLVTDDPVRFRIDVAAVDSPRAGLDAAFEQLGGAFRLRTATGRLAVTGWDAAGRAIEAGSVVVLPGPYTLSVFGRRPFDGARHEKEMAALLGPEWRYMQRIDRLGLLGCLPLALVAIAAAAGKWAWLWVLGPLLAATWLPSLALRSMRRYKAAQEAAAAHDRARPHFVIAVAPAPDDSLPGGFIRV